MANTPVLDDQLLDVRGVVAVYGLPERLARSLFSDRRVPLVKVGGRRLFVRRADMDAYLAGSTIPAKADR